MTKTCLASALMLALFLLSSCSQTTQPPAAGGDSAAKPAESSAAVAPVTAKTAYWEMYKLAYKWTPDILALKLEPKEMPGFSNDGGKAAIWEGTFASPSQHSFRTFTYAIAAHPPDIYKGVTVADSIPWRGVTAEVMPIRMADVSIDSDAAYSAATADAAEWLKKNPSKKLTSFQLGNGNAFPAPVWYFLWGDQKSGYAAFVNATTGKVLRKK